MSSILPQQKLSKAEKEEGSSKTEVGNWYKENGKYFIDQSSFYSGDRWELILLYKAARGDLDKAAYKYVLNPYNSIEENLQNYPAQLRNYDIIIPIINLFLGEKVEKPSNAQVIVLNPDVPNKQKEELDKAFMQYLSQAFINTLNDNGVNTGVESQELPDHKEILDKYKVGDGDKRAIFGQEALDYIRYNLNTKDKFQEAFYDWLVTGRTYTYKDVYKNDLLYEIVPPLEAWHGTTKTGFVEDANWFVRRTRYNMNDCIDRFHEVLSDEEIKNIQSKFINGNDVTSTSFSAIPNMDKIAASSSNTDSFNTQGLIDVFHCVWKSFQKVGILKYIDETGLPQEMEVSEDYVLNKENGDIEIEWIWLNQINEVYRLGQDIFKYGRPLQVQRDELSNISICKLPYNGRTGYNERNKVTSIVKQLLPYQALYNIYHYRAELTLARSKDKIMLMPLGLLPDGWTEDKFLYYAESTGLAFFDETKPNAAAVLNAIRSIDLSLGNYVEQMRGLLSSIKNEAWDAVGMNRQRFGDISASDGKGVTEQAQIRSSTISREMFRRFERLEESDFQGLIDYSKVAWINGKKGMYITSEGNKAMLTVDNDQHPNTDYGVFVRDSSDENEKLTQGKQYAFGWAQKGGVQASTVLEILDGNNMSKVKNIVKQAEEIQQKLAEQQAQSQQQHEAELQKIQQDGLQADRDVKIQVAQIQAGAMLNAANVKAHVDLENGKQIPEDNSDETQLKIQERYDKIQENLRNHSLEKQKLGEKLGNNIGNQRLTEADLALKKQAIESKEKIATINKNRYDK